MDKGQLTRDNFEKQERVSVRFNCPLSIINCQLLVLLFTFSFSLCSAQKATIDSITHVLKTELKDDSNKVNTLNALSGKLWRMDKYDTAIICANNARTLAEKIDFKRGIIKAWRNCGSAYYNQGNYFKSLESYTKSLALSQQIGDQASTALDLGGVARVQYIQGNYPNAMDYYLKALTINQKLGDKDAIASNYGNMANIYNSQANYDLAIEYHKKAIDIYTETGNKNGIKRGFENISILYRDEKKFPEAIDYEAKALQVCRDMKSEKNIATAYNNMGEVYNKQGNYSMAMIYYDSAINLNRKNGNIKSVSINLVNQGEVYRLQGNYPKALQYDNEALAIRRQLGDKSTLAYAYDDIGEIYIQEKKYDIGRKYTDSSIMFSKAIGEKFLVKDGYHDLVEIDSGVADYKTAFEDYKKYVAYSDSLLNDANTQKTVQAEMNYDFNQKQAAEKADQDKKDAIAEQDRKRQAIILYSVLAGFLLLMALTFFIFRGLRQNQKANRIITKQKEEVEQQKAMVDEKNKEILDSINYAKRLQDAILPPLALIKQHLPESFVLYKPKDIVAGDFYWMEVVKAPSGDIVLIAACDCTGHGVPGALVSVVCSNALNRTVKEFKITQPGKILDKVRELVLETFEKSESNVQDGMDISLCCLNTKTGEAQWSGAYNSLWYVQNNELKEIDADKQPIGKNDRPVPFNTHNVKFEKGDILYLFTDGYADQFGGPKGKKFKYKTLQQLIMDNVHLTMPEQETILNKTIEDWKGGLEQVDDVLIMGIRV